MGWGILPHYLQIGLDEALAIEKQGDAQKYADFVDKFKAKKTTDDCYTPENIMEAVNGWVCDEYRVDPARFVRPFWPGADYEQAEYPEGCVVVDNPPFSILSKITRFYVSRGIQFFLFGPALTILSGSTADMCCICTGVSITYQNGAQVPTSFITNMDAARMRTAPELYRRIDAANKENEKALHAELPKYEYPDNVITAAIAQRWCKYGVAWSVGRSDSMMVRQLDTQKATGKTIFGGGLLLSNRAAAERAAAERAAAERAAAHRWELSGRELRMVESMEAYDAT
jgi:hypothetical protein